MGKESRSKSRIHSLKSPISSVQFDIDDDNVNNDLFDEIMSHLNGLPKDKIIGALLFADSIITNDGHLKTFSLTQIKQLIRTLAPLICDRVENVRATVLDAFCQICSSSDSLSDLMVECDVMTPLLTQTQKYQDFVWNCDSKSKSLIDIFERICQLLSSLCDINDKTVKLFTNSGLIQIMINAIKSYKICCRASIAAAQLLCVLTDDNVIPQLLADESILLLKNIVLEFKESPANMHLAILSSFILFNLNIDLNHDFLNNIFDVIDKTLSESCTPQLNQLVDLISKKEKEENELLKCNDHLHHILISKRIAFELLTNLTCEDNDENEEEMECDDTIEDDDDEEADGDVSNVEEEFSVDEKFEKFIIEKSFFEKIIIHLDLIEEDLKEKLKLHEVGNEALCLIYKLQRRALICIHNFVLSFPKKLSLNNEILKKICDLIFESNEQSLFEDGTESLRAIISKSDLLINCDQLERLFNICNQQGFSSRIKINVVKIMGILAERSNDMQFIEKVIVLFMNTLNSEIDLNLRAEIFDSLIDVLSEDEKTDSIIKKLLIINQLKELEKKFKKEINNKRLKRDPTFGTIALNLKKFINYKQKKIFAN